MHGLSAQPVLPFHTTYDGDGKRVKKNVYNSNEVLLETVIFVYSGGKLIEEHSTKAPPQNPTTKYVATDTLQSVRAISNQDGEVISRRDFLPFGQEIPNADDPGHSASLRTSALKYGADDVRQKFTGYQKDEESGLDFAEARMYNNRHARFTAVDPLLASGKSSNPQTFNRYAYVMNSPLNLSDPTGEQAGDYSGDIFWTGNINDPFRLSRGVFEGKRYEKYTGPSFVSDRTDGYRYRIGPAGYWELGRTVDLKRQEKINASLMKGWVDHTSWDTKLTGLRNAEGMRELTVAGDIGLRNFVNSPVTSNIVTLPGFQFFDTSLNSFGVPLIVEGREPASFRQATGAKLVEFGAIAVTGGIFGGAAGRISAFNARGATFSERFFHSRTFGVDSKLFGNSLFGNGRAGVLNRAGSPLKLGWSKDISEPMSAINPEYGAVLRFGVGAEGNRARVHSTVRFTYVPEEYANRFNFQRPKKPGN